MSGSYSTKYSARIRVWLLLVKFQTKTEQIQWQRFAVILSLFVVQFATGRGSAAAVNGNNLARNAWRAVGRLTASYFIQFNKYRPHYTVIVA